MRLEGHRFAFRDPTAYRQFDEFVVTDLRSL